MLVSHHTVAQAAPLNVLSVLEEFELLKLKGSKIQQEYKITKAVIQKGG